jgi:hypothetical protein
MNEIKPVSSIKSLYERVGSSATIEVILRANESEITELRAAYEALQKEIAELKHINLTSLSDLHFKNRELEDKNAAQVKQIEIAREYLQRLSCLGNGSLSGNSLGNVIAIEGLNKLAESKNVDSKGGLNAN